MRVKMDFGNLIFKTDDLRNKGNEAYDSGNYYEALAVYEQVLTCFLWLQFNLEERHNDLFFAETFKPIIDNDIDIQERRTVILEDREMEVEGANNMIIGTLINCIYAYMSMFHFEEAKLCIEFLIQQNFGEIPEIYY